MRALPAVILSCALSVSARAATTTAPEAPGAPGSAKPMVAVPGVGVPGGLNLGGPALPLIPQGPQLQLDEQVQAAMANPIPNTAIGLRPEYFTLDPAQLQAQAAGAPAAVRSERALAAASAPNAKAAVEQVSARVFDGDATRAAAPKTQGAAAPSTAYLSRARRLSGAALLRELHDATGPSAGFRPIGYASAQRALFASVARVKVKGRAGVRDAYSGAFIEDPALVSVEHVWPQGLYGGNAPMRSDLHALLATLADSNGARGDRPYGVVRGAAEWSNPAGAKRGGGVFEPPDSAKGVVARAMLYFYLRYYDRGIVGTQAKRAFWNRQLPLFLEWNRRFPPAAQEKQANAMARVEQGNLNPLVDDPSLADRIGEQAFRAAGR